MRPRCPLSLPIYDRVDIAVRVPEPGDPHAAHHVDIAFLAGVGDIVALESDASAAKRLHRGIHLSPAIQVTAVARFVPALADWAPTFADSEPKPSKLAPMATVS